MPEHMYNARILCDSVSPTGKRLTTFEVTFPRIVLAEAKTHRLLRGAGGNVEEILIDGLGINDDENLSRNSASSRAIPLTKQLERVMTHPFVPARFPLNCKGMQPQEYVEADHPMYQTLVAEWLEARDKVLVIARQLSSKRNVHKQIVNRLLEPWMWHTAILTATEWDNFFALRCHPDAQFEVKRIADLMYDLYHNPPEAPQLVGPGLWHCPLIDNEDLSLMMNWYLTKSQAYEGLPAGYEPATTELMKRMSAARCARVSMLNHDGKRDVEADLGLFGKLIDPSHPLHASPFEHVATPYYSEGLIQDVDRTAYYGKKDLRSGNFVGWKQMRKFLPGENVTNFRKKG